MSLKSSLMVGLLTLVSSIGSVFGFTFTSFREPTTDTTLAWKINNAGRVTAAAFNLSGGGPSFNFIHDINTSLNEFYEIPGAELVSLPGINDAGVLAGGAVFGGNSRGFVRASDGTVTFFDRPGFVNTSFADINNSGTIVGGNGGTAFLFDGTNYTSLSVAGSSFVVATDINNLGTVVGYFRESPGRNRGFVRQSDGTVTTFQLPFGLTDAMEVNGINDAGLIVGYDGEAASFLWDGTNFTQFSVPGALGTFATGINDNDQITGFWFDNTTTYGFVAVIPEPATLWFFAGVGLSVLCRRRP